jgi:mannose/fructose/sorbose-specific phosphotransferase system IIA component
VRKILVVSHGTMAKGVYQAAKMIYGNLENVYYLCLEENMGIELFKEKLNELIDKIKEASQIIVLADLKGGSPYTTAVTLLSEKGMLEKCRIISGLNLPMLLSVLLIENEIGQRELEDVISSAIDGISQFEVQEDDDDIL